MTALLCVALRTKAHAEVLLEAFTGKRILHKPSNLTVQPSRMGSRLILENVIPEDKSFRPFPYYGYRAAYFLESAPWLGWSLEFLHSKDFAVRGDDTRVRANFLTLSLQARAALLRSEDFPRGRVWPYVGFGAGPVIAYSEGDGGEGGYQLSNRPGYQVYAGSRLRLTRLWQVFSEYKYAWTRLDADDPEARYRIHQVVFGVGLAF